MRSPVRMWIVDLSWRLERSDHPPVEAFEAAKHVLLRGAEFLPRYHFSQ